LYKRILVPVDGSEKAATAAIHGAELASKLGSELLLFHVVPSLPPYVDPSPDRLSNIQQVIIDEFSRHGREILDKVKDDLEPYGLNILTDIAVGHPAEEIVKKAKDMECDLVIMGSRGLGEIKGYLLGSVSNRVTRHAACPVLVVR
jgi:nucleotide-binding universal stress UspA family protein